MKNESKDSARVAPTTLITISRRKTNGVQIITVIVKTFSGGGKGATNPAFLMREFLGKGKGNEIRQRSCLKLMMNFIAQFMGKYGPSWKVS